MSNTIKTIFAFGLIVFAAACAQQEEVVMVEPAPIMEEPTMEKF